MKKQYFTVQPAENLTGSITLQGSKNLLLQLIWLPILTQGKVTLRNVPKILDTEVSIKILQGLGFTVTKLSETDYLFEEGNLDSSFFDSEDFAILARKIRGSVTMMGASIARFKRFTLYFPGGDKIGLRPIDVHRKGIIALGATLKSDEEKAIVVCNQLIGAKIFQDCPSVTGTASTVMAAVLAKGETRILNAACEPYIVELVKALNQAGAKISGEGTNIINITGVDNLIGDVDITLLPDMIEVASFMSLAHLVGDKGLLIKSALLNSDPDELGLLLPSFRKLGVKFEVKGRDIFIPKQDKYYVEDGFVSFVDGPWPQFCPDWLSPILVFSTQVIGKVLWHQHMFEDRLFFTDNLRHMGCDLQFLNRHEVLVIGGNRDKPGKFRLTGITLATPDIRAGIAMLIAALSAKSSSIIFNIEQIDRGYGDIENRLSAIGCKIERHEIG